MQEMILHVAVPTTRLFGAKRRESSLNVLFQDIDAFN